MLVLHGMPDRFGWPGASGWLVAAVASLGAAGLCVAAIDTIPRLSRAATAVLLTAAVYWIAMLPLWFFSDHCDLAMVPAGDITAVKLKTLDFSAHSEFLVGTAAGDRQKWQKRIYRGFA